jgi:hypothetical protein
MEKNDFIKFAQTYDQVKAICKEIMKKLSCEEGGVVNECIVNSEFPEFESLYITKDGDVEFTWSEVEFGREIERGVVCVPKEVFINENVDEWCENAIIEHKRQIQD